MEKYNRWDVWYACCSFEEDDTQHKNRPVVVISENNTVRVFALMITGTKHEDEVEQEIGEWQKCGLTKPSVVRLTHSYILNKTDFIKKLGTLSLQYKLDMQHL
jgi:hypothetical protein